MDVAAAACHLAPDNEPLWVRLSGQQGEDRWAAMSVAEDGPPPEQGQLKGVAFFGLTPRTRSGRRWRTWERLSPRTEGGILMAEQGKSGELVTLQELAVSNAYEIAALVAILERKGILSARAVGWVVRFPARGTH